MAAITLDMTGKPCPIPVIEAKKALAGAAAGDTVAVLVDNDVARQNLEKMASGLGHAIAHRAEGAAILATITVGAACAAAPDGGGLVVAIGRDVMGGGDDALGRTLLKNFIYSLTELDVPPERLLFFNGGAALTCEGSAALDDLRALAAKGTAIDTCGACLDFYQLKDALRVGGVTNMFAIMSAMAGAARLVNL